MSRTAADTAARRRSSEISVMAPARSETRRAAARGAAWGRDLSWTILPSGTSTPVKGRHVVSGAAKPSCKQAIASGSSRSARTGSGERGGAVYRRGAAGLAAPVERHPFSALPRAADPSPVRSKSSVGDTVVSGRLLTSSPPAVPAPPQAAAANTLRHRHAPTALRDRFDVAVETVVARSGGSAGRHQRGWASSFHVMNGFRSCDERTAPPLPRVAAAPPGASRRVERPRGVLSV